MKAPPQEKFSPCFAPSKYPHGWDLSGSFEITSRCLEEIDGWRKWGRMEIASAATRSGEDCLFWKIYLFLANKKPQQIRRGNDLYDLLILVWTQDYYFSSKKGPYQTHPWPNKTLHKFEIWKQKRQSRNRWSMDLSFYLQREHHPWMIIWCLCILS